jgi:hypothetical protein
MEKNTELLHDAALKSTDILFKTDTVFPFTLFPDTITIDREKLSIAYRLFFRIANISTTPLDDIESVDVSLGPFFGSLRITSKFFVNNIRTVNFLSRDDAVMIQRILHGHKLTKEKDVDCSKVATKDLVPMLLELGKGAPD